MRHLGLIAGTFFLAQEYLRTSGKSVGDDLEANDDLSVIGVLNLSDLVVTTTASLRTIQLALLSHEVVW